MKTHFSKGREGYEALTTVDMPELGKGYQLRVSTHKRYAGGVTTSASCVEVMHDTGSGFTGFSFKMFGDFAAQVKVDGVALRAPRCTEKSVAEQHTVALAQIEVLKQSARDYYAAKEAKAVRLEEAEAY